MKELTVTPTVVDQVYQAILFEISEGKLPPGSRIIQEQIAQQLGVSRQPVQQALLLLRNQGVLQSAPGRGLIVAPMDLNYVQNMYDIRAVFEGLACSLAAKKNAALARKVGPALIKNGFKAVTSGSVANMIAADMKFHQFIYRISENPLIGPAMESHWVQTQRVMGEVLMRDERPRDIWAQHEEILNAIIDGNAVGVEAMVREHVTSAAKFMISRMRGTANPVEDQLPGGKAKALLK